MVFTIRLGPGAAPPEGAGRPDAAFAVGGDGVYELQTVSPSSSTSCKKLQNQGLEASGILSVVNIPFERVRNVCLVLSEASSTP